ncbi:hypothetical protein ABPG72_013611 [Tetrahymena utriculariae]
MEKIIKKFISNPITVFYSIYNDIIEHPEPSQKIVKLRKRERLLDNSQIIQYKYFQSNQKENSINQEQYNGVCQKNRLQNQIYGYLSRCHINSNKDLKNFEDIFPYNLQLDQKSQSR